MNSIPKILDASLSDCFGHHMQHSAPPHFQEKDDLAAAERQFLDTLSEQQRASYIQLTESLLVAVEAKECEHYYRLGFKDGLTAWRGA